MSELGVRLQASAGALATRVTAAMYADPFWLDRFGDRGRRFAEEDGRHHVAYLIEALTAEDPGLLVSYARWLREVLVSRGMCSRHLADNFDRLATAIDALVPASTAATEYLAVARAGLVYGTGPAAALERVSGDLGAAAARVLRASAAVESVIHQVPYVLSYAVDAMAHGRPDRFHAHARWLGPHLERIGVPADIARGLWSALARADRDTPSLDADARGVLSALVAEHLPEREIA